MTEEQRKHSEQRHGEANAIFLERLKELGWIVCTDEHTLIDKECDMCNNAVCKGKE